MTNPAGPDVHYVPDDGSRESYCGILDPEYSNDIWEGGLLVVNCPNCLFRRGIGHKPRMTECRICSLKFEDMENPEGVLQSWCNPTLCINCDKTTERFKLKENL